MHVLNLCASEALLYVCCKLPFVSIKCPTYIKHVGNNHFNLKLKLKTSVLAKLLTKMYWRRLIHNQIIQTNYVLKLKLGLIFGFELSINKSTW